jgi:hypothetical protein
MTTVPPGCSWDTALEIDPPFCTVITWPLLLPPDEVQ